MSESYTDADVERVARMIYEAVCASTDPGVSLWYQSIDRSEFMIAARAVLSDLYAPRQL